MRPSSRRFVVSRSLFRQASKVLWCSFDECSEVNGHDNLSRTVVVICLILPSHFYSLY